MRASTDRPPKPALGLAWRIFTAMSLVVIAGAGTLLVSALLVARPVFNAHLDQVRPLVSVPAQAHVDEAFSNAVLIALSVGVTAALAAALVVTWLATFALQRVNLPAEFDSAKDILECLSGATVHELAAHADVLGHRRPAPRCATTPPVFLRGSVRSVLAAEKRTGVPPPPGR